MAAKLLIQQGGVTRELTAQDFNSVQYDAQAGTSYELLDDNGNVIHDYTTRVENGKLLIDVAGTSASPDFILNNYTSYFPAPQSGGMGSGYFGTAAAESAVNSAVKASTVGSSGGGGALLGGLLGLAAIGGVVAAASGGSSKDKDKDNTTNSGSQTAPNTNTDKNTGSTNNTSTTPSNNSGSQTASNTNTDKNTGGTNNTSTTPSNNSGNQTAPNTNTDKNTGSTNNTSTTPSNNSGNQTAPNTNTDKNTGTNNTTPTDNTGSQNPTTPSTKDVLHGNSIKLPTAYTHKVLSGSDLNAITQAAKGGVEMNQYQSSAENQKIIINDLNNLSREVQTELSLFVAQLLNPIRKQWNMGLFKVTDGAMNFAQDIANEYVNDGRSIFDGKSHHVPGITKVAAKYGLNTKGNFYENMGGAFIGYKKDTLTLDDLKKSTYESMVRMLFADERSEHGHAKSLLAAGKYTEQNTATEYLGLDTSRVVINSDSKDWGEFGIHFISANENIAYVQDQAKFNATIATPEITSMPATKTSPRMVYLDDDNSHLSTTQFGESDDSTPQITQKFTFSQLLEGNVRQLADEYDENDVLALSQNAFSALNKDQSNLHEHISYDSTTGLLSYDADGVSGSIAPVAFAQLAQGLQQDQIQFEIL